MRRIAALFLIISSSLIANESLFRDLLIVDAINQRLEERFPVTYNHLLYGGYLNMPSARMGECGELGAGFAYVSPYHLYNLRFQLLSHVELSANYRVFSNIADPILSESGFGDFSDKGANLKVAFLRPHDSGYKLPGVAFGLEDFIGTRAFRAHYIVATQVIPKWNLEMSLGYGKKKIRGFFGGAAWFPFRGMSQAYLREFCLVGEYDATPYSDEKREPHPEGHDQSLKWNFGLKTRLFDCCYLSLSYVRGEKIAFSASTFYNLGNSPSLLPKIEDFLPYSAPCNQEPLGQWRSELRLVSDLLYPLGEQGFTLRGVWLSYSEENERILRIQVYNRKWHSSYEVQRRLAPLFKSLIPSNIDFVIATVEGEGMPLYDIEYCMEYLRSDLCENQVFILFPLKEATTPNLLAEGHLFTQEHQRISWFIVPKTYTLYGSSKGKFKYAAGIQGGLFGYLPYDIYYSVRLGWLPISSLYSLKDVDKLNPSRLPNVHTDIIRYYQNKSPTLDEAYLQKNWNLGKGCYGRLSMGYFDLAYAGTGAELLYYPLDSTFAFGIEGALLKKRNYSGLGFSDQVRELKGPREELIPTYQPFLGSQYFASVYYNFAPACLDFKIQGGKFLANDYGARFEVSRYFPSGLRVTFWYTCTNGHDIVNGSTYYDKGISLSLPLDFFTPCTKKDRVSYGMSAWLRDVGYRIEAGRPLYELLQEGR